jgi:hypothetical protein
MDPDVGIPGLAQRPQEWEGALMPQAVVWRAPHGPQVTELHVERVIERDGATSLESTDVWVDATTLGVRLVAKAVLPLRQVGSAPGGLKLFAGRDERSDGKRYLQFIVLRNADFVDRHSGAISGTRAGSILPATTCSHARVALLSNKPGETASLQLMTMLPPLPPSELSPAPPGSRVPPPTKTSGKNDLRVRPLRIHVSVSQTTRDSAPVLAVSTAWAGPELVHRATDPKSRVAPAPPPFMPASTTSSSAAGF